MLAASTKYAARVPGRFETQGEALDPSLLPLHTLARVLYVRSPQVQTAQVQTADGLPERRKTQTRFQLSHCDIFLWSQRLQRVV